ncbi:unnamed protein product, partial [marine sediment metagenome]
MTPQQMQDRKIKSPTDAVAAVKRFGKALRLLKRWREAQA